MQSRKAGRKEGRKKCREIQKKGEHRGGFFPLFFSFFISSSFWSPWSEEMEFPGRQSSYDNSYHWRRQNSLYWFSRWLCLRYQIVRGQV
jgi:hypothetical protein